MALLNERRNGEAHRGRCRHPRAVGDGGRECLRRARLREAGRRLRLTFGRRFIPVVWRPSRRWHSPGRRRPRSGRGHRHQPLALSPKLHHHRHRPVVEDAREGARNASRGRACATAACWRWTPQQLAFADNTFDIVYAPYVISVVPDPVKVAREMRRVCRPGGRIVILNHFKSDNRDAIGKIETGDLADDRAHRLQEPTSTWPVSWPRPSCTPISIEKVNVPPRCGRW